METLHVLTDVYGPRLTGSPNYKAAADWAVQQLTSWGLVNARLEPWDFGHPGWTNERTSAFVVSPYTDTLTVEVVAWTPGTNGAVRGRGRADRPARPGRPSRGPRRLPRRRESRGQRARSSSWARAAPVPVAFTAPAKRRDDAELRTQYDPENPNPQPRPARDDGAPAQQGGPQQGPARLTANQVNETLDAFLVANGACVRVNDAGREHGQIRAFNNRTFDVAQGRARPSSCATRTSDASTACMAGGTTVELEFDHRQPRRTPRARPPTTWSPRSRAPTRPTRW